MRHSQKTSRLLCSFPILLILLLGGNFDLMAQTAEKSTSKVKKLYEKKEAEDLLKQVQEIENKGITENELRNIVNNMAEKECNEEIAEQGGGRMMITNEPINVIINKCVKRKTPEMWNRKNEIKKTYLKGIRDGIEEMEKALTLEGCREFAEKDKECTDDLIVKFDRFGTCICETY